MGAYESAGRALRAPVSVLRAEEGGVRGPVPGPPRPIIDSGE